MGGAVKKGVELMANGVRKLFPARTSLVNQVQTQSIDEDIARLCDIAMCGDHGIGEEYGAVLDLPKCIAKGDDICALRYHKNNK